MTRAKYLTYLEYINVHFYDCYDCYDTNIFIPANIKRFSDTEIDPIERFFENKQHKLSISPLNSNSQSCELMNNLATKLEGHRWMLHEPISDYILVESRVLVMLTHTCILLYWRAQSSIVIIGGKCPSLWKHEIQFIFKLRATAKFRKKNPVLLSNNTIFPLCSSRTCFGKMKISLSVLERARVSTLCAAHQFSFHINSTNRPIGADGRRQRT